MIIFYKCLQIADTQLLLLMAKPTPWALHNIPQIVRNLLTKAQFIV